MARRRQMRIDPSVFLQQQGGGDEASQLAMAMEMLGFGKGQEGARGQLALNREQLQAETQRYGRGQDIEEQKLAAELDRTAKQEAFNNWVKEQQIEQNRKEQEYKASQLTNETLKARLGVAQTMMGDTGIPIADRQKMWAQFDPAIKEMLTVGAEQADKTKVGEFLPKLRAVYAKGAPKGELDALLAGYQGILQRPEIDWQKENQGVPAPQPGFWERLRNLGGSERERAVAEAAKVAPPSGAAPSTVTPTSSPMAFTGYEAPVEGPVRRGYGAVPGGDVGGPALPELLAKIMGPAAPPSSGRGYYTPQAPVEVPPAFEYMAGGPSAMPPRIQPQVSVNDLLSKLMTPGISAMAPY